LLNYDADAAFPSLDYLLSVYLDIVDQTVMLLFELHQDPRLIPICMAKSTAS
jgi:hypothetical protein